jgi:hypothetical protein
VLRQRGHNEDRLADVPPAVRVARALSESTAVGGQAAFGGWPGPCWRP